MERTIIDIDQQKGTTDFDTQKVYSRAVEAVIWGVPIVSVHAMRDAFFRDAKATYGDIVYLSKPADWKFQITTPNASSYYAYTNINTKNGPVVLELPEAVGVGLFGSFNDAWQVPLIDVGPAGADRGKGGKYIILPPRYTDEISTDYIAVHSETFNGYAFFRIIPLSSSDRDTQHALELVKKIRCYPLTDAAKPPAQKHIEMSGKLFDGIVAFDDTFFYALAAMIQEEPVHTRDLVAIARLQSIGIEKDKHFNPDPTTRNILKRAAVYAHHGLMDDLVYHHEIYWEGTHWGTDPKAGPLTGFSFLSTDGHYYLDQRAVTFFMACAPPKKPGAATFYIGAMLDANGKQFDGSKTYHLRIPPNVPARQYWAITVYDLSTAAFIADSPVLSLDSYNLDMSINEDESVEVFFGPKPPSGEEANWIYTEPGKPWFAYFRFYGPQKAVFEKTWRMEDIREINI